MARSSYIYYFQSDVPFGVVLAAFTVKHEALAMAEKCGWDPSKVALFRVRDGRLSRPELLKEWNRHDEDPDDPAV